MRGSNQAHDDGRKSEWLSNHPLAASTLVYALLCIPVFVWLDGPVGSAGTVDTYTTIIALALGGILLVPVVQSYIVGNFAASRVDNIGGAGD